MLYRLRVPRDYLRRLPTPCVAAQRPIRTLKAINWDPRVHEHFFKHGAKELPGPEYPPLGLDPADKAKELKALRKQIRGKNPVEEMLREKCDEFVLVAQMLAARGTKRFCEFSRRLFGDPRDRFPDNRADNLAIGGSAESPNNPRIEIRYRGFDRGPGPSVGFLTVNCLPR